MLKRRDWLHCLTNSIICPLLIFSFWALLSQIKWLTDVEVTDLESDNHYHYFDNRVLPSQVCDLMEH